MAGTNRLKPLIPALLIPRYSNPGFFFHSKPSFRVSAAKMSTTSEAVTKTTPSKTKTIDSYLHIWASPEEAANKYPCFPGQEPTLPGNLDFLIQCMEEASVDGAPVVQPINDKFDHSLVTSALKKYPSKFVGCCLANPTEDGSGVKQLEQLVMKDGFRAIRFSQYLWPSGQQMTNEVGKAMFSKAGELGVPGLNLHISEIEKLCTEFPSTLVLVDHLAFCKPPINNKECLAFSNLLKLSRFPQIQCPVYVKFSDLFRVSRMLFPCQDLSASLLQVVSSFGANRVMWGSDSCLLFLNVVIKEERSSVSNCQSYTFVISELKWIMG